MSQSRRVVVAGILMAAIVSLVTSLSAEEAAPVHRDATQLLEAIEAGARAHIVEDLSGMLAALDQLEANTRELNAEDKSVLGSDMVVYDQAFFATVRKSRSFALEGKLDDAFNQFVWVQRACVVCHGIARDAGMELRFPEAAP